MLESLIIKLDASPRGKLTNWFYDQWEKASLAQFSWIASNRGKDNAVILGSPLLGEKITVTKDTAD